jgi:hypothetical protein
VGGLFLFVFLTCSTPVGGPVSHIVMLARSALDYCAIFSELLLLSVVSETTRKPK